MIIIDNIRIRNFRAIREAKLEPLKEGITGIFGSNGAGKTTFLIGTLFALYGVRPEGSTVASLRRHGSEKEECSVSVVFEHLGQTIEVLREISGRNNTVKAWVYIDGKEISKGSVGYTEKWIRARLGVDAEGFKTAFVVRQKELDLLVSSKPSERKVIIERLAGIETINSALKSAREEENASKKALINLPGSLEAFREAEELFVIEEQKHEGLQTRIASGNAKRLEAKESYDILDRKYTNAKDQKYELDKSITRLDNMSNERAEKQSLLDEAKIRHDGVTKDTVDMLEGKFKALDVELENMRKSYTDLNVKSQVAKQNIINIEQELASLSTIVEPETPKVSSSEIDEQILVLESSKNDVINEKHVLGARRESLVVALAAVENETCPTCLRPWEDHDHDKGKYAEDLKNIEEELKTVVAKEAEFNDKIRAARAEKINVVELENNVIEFNNSKKKIAELKVQLKANQKNVVDDSVLTGITEDGKKLSLRRDAHFSAFTEAKTALTFAERVKTLTDEIIAIDNLIPVIEEDIKEKKQTIPDLDSLEIEYNEAKALLERIESLLTEVNNEYNIHNVVFLQAQNEAINQKNMWEARQNAHSRHEQITATTETLDKFRKDSIGRLAPELSDYATSLISEMTSGAFTEVTLDENFTPSVTDSEGNSRPVTWLSGGEESAVALALRLSIAFLITGGNPELLWLDEVLTAQDTDRRTSMLAMIRALPIKQIVMINHTQEASDVVDKVITLIPNVKSGSVIQ